MEKTNFFPFGKSEVNAEDRSDWIRNSIIFIWLIALSVVTMNMKTGSDTESGLDEIRTNASYAKEGVDRLDARAANLELKTQELESTTDDLESKTDEHESDIQSIMFEVGM